MIIQVFLFVFFSYYLKDYWFEYETIRHCSIKLPFCDSKFLFCDKRIWRCRSKIILGGNCTGFIGTEICYKSICIQVFFNFKYFFWLC
jgi:hypothetical protein